MKEIEWIDIETGKLHARDNGAPIFSTMTGARSNISFCGQYIGQKKAYNGYLDIPKCKKCLSKISWAKEAENA